MRPAPSILVLAAGGSTRMGGRDKLLEEIDGTPLILRAVRAACATAGEVLVALPTPERPHATSRRAWLSDLPALCLTVTDPAMSASIRAGVAACRGDALMLHLADMPDIGAAEMWQLSERWRSETAPILQATDADGRPGQPVIFARALFRELSALTGDTGARPVLARHPVARFKLPGRAATTDLDTPEDWASWRAARIQ